MSSAPAAPPGDAVPRNDETTPPPPPQKVIEEKEGPALAAAPSAEKPKPPTVLELVREQIRRKQISRAWLGVSGAVVVMTLVSLVIFLVKLGIFAGILVVRLLAAWRLLAQIAWVVVGVARYVVAPIVVVFANAWLFREVGVTLLVRTLRDKWGVALRETVALDGDASLKEKRLALKVSNLGVRPDDADEEILAIDAIEARLTPRDSSTTETKASKKKNTTMKTPFLAADVHVDVTKLAVHLVTYDVKFKDTNLSRLLAKFAAEEDDAAPPGEEAKPAEEETPAASDAEPRVRVVRAVIKEAVIAVKAKGPLGTRTLLPITLADEVIDPAVFDSKVKLIAWLNGLVLRAVANSSLDLVSGTFDAVGGVVTGGLGLALGGVDAVADKVPGGSVVKGATAGVRSVVGGAVGGGGKVVGGVTGGGKAIVKGVTSGSVSGVAQGFKDAGKSVGGGVVDGVKSVGGGVVGAGTSVGGGVLDAGRGASKVVSSGGGFTKKGAASSSSDGGATDPPSTNNGGTTDARPTADADAAAAAAAKKKKSSSPMKLFSSSSSKKKT